ncbi:MAG: DUF5722 domain-containing protein [Lachnospiraceae bacterium]
MRAVEKKRCRWALLWSALALVFVLWCLPMGAHAESSMPVQITAAAISGKNVNVTATAAAAPTSDDGCVHLMAQYCYEAGSQGTEVAKVPVSTSLTFTFPLQAGTASSHLMQKFTACVMQSGQLVPVSDAHYITNPEALGKKTARIDDGSKKGFLLDPRLLNVTNYLTEAGVSQVTYNLPIGDLCDTRKGGKIHFTYEGTDYVFNEDIVGQYDLIVPKMNKVGVSVTLILLNNLANSNDLTLIHPLARDTTEANYYAFNTATKEGAKKLAAIAAFLGSRYSGGTHGTVDNWIVGNEANALDWNYINTAGSMEAASLEYEKAVRIFYNGIRSQNASARVYACVDHEWAQSDFPGFHFAAKDFLTTMQAQISAEGNFDYGVAVHPYNVPLYASQTWTMQNLGVCDQTQNSPYITMANIGVFTDFFCQKAMLQNDGQVRSILCSELGYSSMPYNGYPNDENQQAAALVFGYLQAKNNQYIDGFFNREADAPEEIAQGLAVGVLSSDDGKTYTRKLSYDYYKNIDNPAVANDILAACGAYMGGIEVSSLLTPR